MSMASLVVRLARGKTENDMYDIHSSTSPTDHQSHPAANRRATHNREPQFQFQLSSTSNKGHHKVGSDEGLGGIHCRTDLSVVVGNVSKEEIEREHTSSRNSNEARSLTMFGDEMPLGPLSKNGFKANETEIV